MLHLKQESKSFVFNYCLFSAEIPSLFTFSLIPSFFVSVLVVIVSFLGFVNVSCCFFFFSSPTFFKRQSSYFLYLLLLFLLPFIYSTFFPSSSIPSDHVTLGFSFPYFFPSFSLIFAYQMFYKSFFMSFDFLLFFIFTSHSTFFFSFFSYLFLPFHSLFSCILNGK